MLRWILMLVGAVLVLYSGFTAMICNFTLGVVLPAMIGLPLLAVGLFWQPCMAFFAKGFGRVVKWALIGGYAAFALSFAVVTALIAGRAAAPVEPGADCLIVLGAAVRGEVPSATFRARLDCAYDYLAENPETCVIVTGGMGRGESVTEAHAAQQYLMGRGIAKERIYMEEKSTSTQENLLFAKEILESEFASDARLVLVSSDYHLYRAQLVAQKQGLAVETLGNASIPYLLPNFYLREYCAVLGYRLLGRMGR